MAAPDYGVASFDSLDLRRALGAFATGVAVVTARDAQGHVHALTINSFNSVSLEPPLVAWSIRRGSSHHAAFIAATVWAINILAKDQLPIAQQYARRDTLPGGNAQFETGAAGLPLIVGCIASFECTRHSALEMGDHFLLVGEVLAIRRSEAEPLLFFSGQFGARAVA